MYGWKRAKTLCWRTLIAIGLMLVSLILVISLTPSRIMDISVGKLEQKDTAEHMKRLQNAVQGEVDHLSFSRRDWANWNDTYGFIENRNQEYMEYNLYDEALSDSLGINMIVFINREGQVHSRFGPFGYHL